MGGRHVVVGGAGVGFLLRRKLEDVLLILKILRVESYMIISISAFLLMIHPKHMGNFMDSHTNHMAL